MSSALRFTNLDFGPISRFSVGFDELLHDLAKLGSAGQQETSYPPYNIIKNSEDHYSIEVAVAGFDQSEIDVRVENNLLTITGSRSDKNEKVSDQSYIHRGISRRDFNRVFTLGNYIEVRDAVIENGMLVVHLERVVPEPLKPRRIAITSNKQ